jgi:hypothetical protein
MQSSADINNLTKTEVFQAFDQALDFGYKHRTIPKDVYDACKRREYPTMKCVISAYEPAKAKRDGRGYTQIRFKNIKYYCHRIAAAVAGFTLGPEDEASHCCPLTTAEDLGDKRCFNPAHMGAESGLKNKSRLCCILFKDVPNYKCPHRDPPCWGCESVYDDVNSQAEYWQSS